MSTHVWRMLPERGRGRLPSSLVAAAAGPDAQAQIDDGMGRHDGHRPLAAGRAVRVREGALAIALELGCRSTWSEWRGGSILHRLLSEPQQGSGFGRGRIIGSEWVERARWGGIVLLRHISIPDSPCQRPSFLRSVLMADRGQIATHRPTNRRAEADTSIILRAVVRGPCSALH